MELNVNCDIIKIEEDGYEKNSISNDYDFYHYKNHTNNLSKHK